MPVDKSALLRSVFQRIKFFPHYKFQPQLCGNKKCPNNGAFK